MVTWSEKDLFYKLWLLENLGQVNGLLSYEVCFFRVLLHKRIVDHVPRRYLYARMLLRLWLPKVR